MDQIATSDEYIRSRMVDFDVIRVDVHKKLNLQRYGVSRPVAPALLRLFVRALGVLRAVLRAVLWLCCGCAVTVL